MMLSVNLKDSVLTTQSNTVYVDLKSKTKNIYIMTEYEYLYLKKRMCIVLLVGRSTIVEIIFRRKSFPCLVLHQTDKI